jgi:hypothetical protein
MPDSDSNDTLELPACTLNLGADRSYSASARVEVAGLSHPGRVRPNNGPCICCSCGISVPKNGDWLRVFEVPVPILGRSLSRSWGCTMAGSNSTSR